MESILEIQISLGIRGRNESVFVSQVRIPLALREEEAIWLPFVITETVSNGKIGCIFRQLLSPEVANLTMH